MTPAIALIGDFFPDVTAHRAIPRALELAAELPESIHPIPLGPLFQPERAALRGETLPRARTLVRAAAQFSP